jgi:MerR family redox-sensitive transcriptional activator SoxR
MRRDDRLTIGEIARRAGVTPSALRFYESRGLIVSERTAGNQRRYRREMLRRIAFVRIAQQLGVELAEIQRALASLPGGRTPTKQDWKGLSTAWRSRLDDRIALLTRLRDQLASCIGCGCLSLPSCPIYNPEDAASACGPGPRYLLGDKPADVVAARDPRGRQALATRVTRKAVRE